MATLTPRIMMLSVFLTTLPLSKQTANEKYGIGQGFFLSDENILGDDFTEGSSVFDGTQGTCFEDYSKATLKSEEIFFKTTSEFRESVASLVKLGGTYKGKFTMKGTFSAVKETSSSKTNAMSGILLRKQHLKKYTRMTQKCMSDTPLSGKLLKDLNNLPTAIKAPQTVGSWKEYYDFLKKYGSHVLTTIHYGTLMDYWVISESSEKYSQTQFEMKACLDLKGRSIDSLVCSEYNKDQIEKASKFKMSKSLTLLGGSTSTRSKLHQNFTSDQLEQFMQEAKTSPGHVVHDFKPIWEVLRARLDLGNDDKGYNTRLLNLEQYYQGMLDFGCSCQADGSVILRKFFLDNDDKTKPSYSCRIPPLGCRNNNDCRYSWRKAACYCYGESCVDGTDITDIFDTKKSSRFIRKKQIGSFNEGINKECKYVAADAVCNCKNTKTVWTTIWPPRDRLARRSLAYNGKVTLDMKITFSLSGETSPSKNTIIKAITDVFKSYIFDLLDVRVENITKSGQISVRVKFGTNMLKTTIPEKDFRRTIKNKYGRPGELGINPDTINVEYFGVQLSDWKGQPGTCADGTTLKTRQCTEKELKCNGITKDNCVDYYVPSNNTTFLPPTQGPTVTPREPQCDPCICPERHITSSGVTHTVFNFLFIAPLILSAWFRG